MQWVIRILVFAKDAEGALEAAHEVVHEKLESTSSGGPFDYYIDSTESPRKEAAILAEEKFAAALNSKGISFEGGFGKDRWGPIPPVLQVSTARFPIDDKRGLEMVNSAMENNRWVFKNSMENIRHYIDNYTDDQLFDEVEGKGEISPIEAFWSINLDVMIFLLSMFIIGEAMQESGYLFRLSNKIFRWAKNPDQLLILILFGMGFLSAILMNDTLAIIGTPLMLYFARMHQISSKLLLLALAFAVTTGSVISPIGNPQNLLIAINGDFSNPFQDFFQYLFLPTLVNLILAYIILRLVYHDQFKERSVSQNQQPVTDEELAKISRISFLLLIVLIIGKILAVPLGEADMLNLTYIAFLSALPIMIFSHRRFELIRKIDWPTLIFFAAMFVLMESIWGSGIFQQLIADSNADTTSVPMILALSVLVSQLISNVPFVALYQPLIPGSSINNLMALAAGSTIAGNLFILGAASNVIIIQNAEKAGETLTFLEFARVGIPLAALNIAIYWIFLSKIPFTVI